MQSLTYFSIPICIHEVNKPHDRFYDSFCIYINQFPPVALNAVKIVLGLLIHALALRQVGIV